MFRRGRRRGRVCGGTCLRGFQVQREDTSAKARTYRERELAIPSFYGRENEIPGDIRDLFAELKKSVPVRESTTAH
jgi:hypothetical protein